MNAMSYTVARANLAQTMQQVCNDHAPIIITRKQQPAVVMMSLEDYYYTNFLYYTESPSH